MIIVEGSIATVIFQLYFPRKAILMIIIEEVDVTS